MSEILAATETGWVAVVEFPAETRAGMKQRADLDSPEDLEHYKELKDQTMQRAKMARIEEFKSENARASGGGPSIDKSEVQDSVGIADMCKAASVNTLEKNVKRDLELKVEAKAKRERREFRYGQQRVAAVRRGSLVPRFLEPRAPRDERHAHGMAGRRRRRHMHIHLYIFFCER